MRTLWTHSSRYFAGLRPGINCRRIKEIHKSWYRYHIKFHCFAWYASPVLWRPPKSRNPYNVKPFLTDISVTVAQIQKIQKTRCILFRILLLVGPSPPSQLVPNPFNWSPNTVFTDISATVAQIQKFQKARCIFFFEFCFWEDPPHPVNWSPTHSKVYFFKVYFSKVYLSKVY